MYIEKYWDEYIGGSDDSLNLVAFLEDQKKEEISLSEIFDKIGLNKLNWNFRQTVEYLGFTHSNGVEIDFYFAIDVITDLAAILLECKVNKVVNLHELDEYDSPSRNIRIIVTPEEYNALDKEVSWVHNMSPSLRNLTGSELAGAVQRYGILKVSQKYTKDALKIDLENFHDHAYLMVRLNQNEVKKVKNGKVTHLTGDLYLLEATNKSVTITLK